jgi:mRNA-degrading endonuclease toxin of MazEF toxin-antitoxin module
VSFRAGQIVIVDWREALPKEPGKRRPAIVVEDGDLFDPSYPNLILVPLTDDSRLAIADLSVLIPPSPTNGCSEPGHALAHHVTTASKARPFATACRVTDEQLAEIRQRIAIAPGIA